MFLLLFLSASSVVAAAYLKWDFIKIRFFTLLRNKVGLDSFDALKLSFDSNKKHLVIYVSGVKLHKVQNQQQPATKESSPLKSWINRLMSSRIILEFVLNIPVHLVMATLASYVSLHVDSISFRLDQNITLYIEHFKIESVLNEGKQDLVTVNQLFQEKTFTIQIQIGPTTLKLLEKSVVDMTTICLAYISCHFRAGRLFLKDLDFDLQLGKMIVDMNACMDAIQNYKQKQSCQTINNSDSDTKNSSNKNIIRLEDILSSINFRIQSIHFTYVINKEIVTNFDICNGALFISSVDGQPSCQLTTEKISLFLAHHRLVYVLGMEINVSLPDENSFETTPLDTLLSTDLVSIVWTIDSPKLQIPFQSKIVQETLRWIHISQLPAPETSTNQVPQKQISDLPMCHFAIILNSPKLELTEISGLCGYMSSQSLIVRLSGEYILKGRSSIYNDVSSSSSSSSTSHLDTLFAREEYKWLSYSPDQKRHSIHDINLRSETPIGATKPRRPITAKNRLRSLLGRVSRHRRPLEARPNTHKKWNYKVSMKLILQRASVGYVEKANDKFVEEFARIKHAVIIAKTNMNVVQHSDNMDRYDILFTLGNTINSEAAIDKPMICLCQQDTAMSASIFWLKSVPQALQRQYLSIFEKQEEKPEQQKSARMQLLAKCLSFSLDVTEGSIASWSVDAKHKTPVNVPEGYIDNTPTQNIHTRMILDTQKFTFVYEGMKKKN